MKKSLVLIVFVVLTSFALGGVAFSAHDFPDVPDSHPFHEDISWMADTGVTEGFADGTFKPGQAVTRQSMAAFMRRLAGADPDVPRVVDAAELGGRNAADFDNAVSLNGRTPADYDDAVTLAGRTPADYDNAVSLNGRTPADFDNAVSLNGRTPADYDDAETIDGVNGGDLMRVEILGVGSDPTPILGISSGTASVVHQVTPYPSIQRLVLFNGLIDTSFDSVKVSCQVDGDPLTQITDVNIGDNAIGYTDRLPISLFYFVNVGDAGALSCWYTSPVGTGALEVEEKDAMQFIIGDYSEAP